MTAADPYTGTIPAPPLMGDPSPAVTLARHFAGTAYCLDAHIQARPGEAPKAAIHIRNLSLAAAHLMRALIYACQQPGTARTSLPDQAAREVVTAWQEGEAGDYAYAHCTALGMDPDAIAALAQLAELEPAEPASPVQTGLDGRSMLEAEIAIGAILGIAPASITESLVIAVDEDGGLRFATDDVSRIPDLVARVLASIGAAS